MPVRLHVNVDHVATLRQARGASYPDPVEAAVVCEHAGADGITVHLREDRRHVQDRDVEILRRTVKTMLNLEMAATEEMLAIAEHLKPDLVTLVPERREERTTEGGLDVLGQRERIASFGARLRAAGIRLSLFVAPDAAQVRCAAELGVDSIELHTGDYAHARTEAEIDRELARLAQSATAAVELEPSLVIAAGHGLTARNTGPLVARVRQVSELNIGHALISDAVFDGLAASVERYRRAIDDGERRR